MTGRSLLRPLSTIFASAVAARGWLYDHGWLEGERLPVPVVSIGNLTVGGTGKTPVVAEILSWLLKSNLRPGLISRGYKRETAGARKVESKNPNGAQLFGDEPYMLACRFQSVPVYVASRRSEAGRLLIAENEVDIILADDAFQHRRLCRDLDVVVMDAMESLENYALMPEGRAREPFSALSRADFIVLSKANFASSSHKERLYEEIRRSVRPSANELPVVECNYVLKGLARLENETVSVTPEKGQRALLVSGIGRPESFEALVTTNFEVAGHLAFRDHHKYTKNDLQNIERAAKAKNVDWIVVTEKDAVKMRALSCALSNVVVAKLEPRFNPEVQKLYDAITRLVL